MLLSCHYNANRETLKGGKAMDRNDKMQQIMDMVKQLTEEQTKEATLVVLAMRTGYELAKAEGKQTA